VSLLAPSPAGAALVGPGPSEVGAVVPWEAASTASLLVEDGAPAPAMVSALASFDAVVAYTGSAALVAGLRRAAPQTTVHSCPPAPPAGVHAARWLADAVVPLAIGSYASPPSIEPTPEEQAAARAWLDRLRPGFVAIHPGSGAASKNWPPERFALVAKAMARGPWLLVEGPADADAVAPLSGLPAVVHARDLPARILGAILAQAGLYVGNDSGVTHLAAAWGAPVVALFGPTDPRSWSPLGPRVTVVTSPDGTMEGIAVDTVLDAARRAAEIL
jgi:heptosyltransferase-3